MNQKHDIERLVNQALSELEKPERLKASDDFFDRVLEKAKASEPAKVHRLGVKDFVKYAAIIIITVLNGFVLYSAASSDETAEVTDTTSIIVDEYFPQYYASNGELP